MKKRIVSTLITIMITASMVLSLGISAMAAEAKEAEDTPEEIVYDFGTAGILDMADYPEYYKEEAEHAGTVTKITYDNGYGEKYFNIYLPYGYDENTDNYNVLYFVHGAGGDPTNYLKTENATSLQKVIDHMFEDGVCDPFIMVAVSWRKDMSEDKMEASGEDYAKSFAADELSRCIVSYVDENYRTNADRDHRAFGGFSMGGCTTWYAFTRNLAYISRFIPLSGDCWEVALKGGESETEKTVAVIVDSIKKQGFKKGDYKIFAATGDKDIAYPALTPMMEALAKESEFFDYSDDYSKGNLHYLTVADKYHSYDAVMLYWQDYLPYIFN